MRNPESVAPVLPLPFEGVIPQGDFDKLVIPLKRINNLLLIEARIDSLEGNFIFDTGAPKLVLNKTYFRNWKTSSGTLAYGIGGGGGQVYHQEIDSLIIRELFFTDIDADVVNLGHIETAKGIKIFGLLGANLFTDMEMVIDENENTLTLYKTDKKGDRISTDADSLIADIEIPLDLDNNILFLSGNCGGKKLRFCLDTGAEINVLGNNVSNKVLSHFSLTNQAILGGSSDQNLAVLRGEIDALQIGTDTLQHLPFILTDLSNLALVYNTTLDGILGYPFLSRGKVILNTKKKKLSMYFYKEETHE